MEFYTCIAKYAFFGIRDEKLLATARKSWYHTMVCSGIEAVITGLTRNRVGRFPEWPRKPLILLASSAFLHFFKTEYLRFFYALSTISTLGYQSAGNPQSLENTAWRCIEVVVTRLTRNQLTGQTVRGFESLHLRQIVLTKKMHSKNAARKCGVFAFKRKNRRIQNRKVRFSKRGSAHSENGGLGDAHGPFYAIR